MSQINAARQQLERILGGVKVPRPFDLERLRHELARARSRDLVHVAVRSHDPSPCGLWISSNNVDYVFFEDSGSALDIARRVCHDLGHMLLGHIDVSPFGASYLADTLPQIAPAAIEKVLGRTAYTRAQERAADEMAALILERAGLTHVPPPRLGFHDVTVELCKLAAALQRTHR